MEIAWIIEDDTAHLEIPLSVRSTVRVATLRQTEPHFSGVEKFNVPSSP
jgi:hypothetical protein